MFAGSGCGDETVPDGLKGLKEVRVGVASTTRLMIMARTEQQNNAYLYWTRLVLAAMFVHVTDLLMSCP